MSIESVQDLISPLFISADQSPPGEVVTICNQSMQDEVEALLSHFGIYLAVVFGSVVWEAFVDPYRISMDAFQYYPLKNCAIKRDLPRITSDDSFDCNFAKWGLTDNLIEVKDRIQSDSLSFFAYWRQHLWHSWRCQWRLWYYQIKSI